MPLLFIPLIFILISFILFGLALLFIYRRYLSQQDKKLLDYTYLPHSKAKFEFINDSNLNHEKITEETIQTLNKNISALYLVHGTFVGEDPFHLIKLIEMILPKEADFVSSRLKSLTKSGQDLVTQDKGNFTSVHLDYLNKYFTDLPIKNFKWSSGNHHVARVKGMIDLAKQLSVSHEKKDRVLLVGHSHAGQVFSLLMQFIYAKPFQDFILSTFASEFNPEFSKHMLPKLKSLTFDIVTMGAPPRYEWPESERVNILHFINHRLEIPFAGKLSGAITTKDGDYIQQWGISGSDFLSLIDEEKKLNKALDPILGVGASPKKLRSELLQRRRLHNIGHHYLVDYGDGGKFPNFGLTVFGHSIYTRKDLLGFHFNLIAKQLYSNKK